MKNNLFIKKYYKSTKIHSLTTTKRLEQNLYEKSNLHYNTAQQRFLSNKKQEAANSTKEKQLEISYNSHSN